MELRECTIEVVKPRLEKSLAVDERLRGRGVLVNLGFDEETAVREAQRCLGTIGCGSCNVCQLFCPELCIIKTERGAEIVYEFCKECGICALVCPKGAIQMVLEE